MLSLRKIFDSYILVTKIFIIAEIIKEIVEIYKGFWYLAEKREKVMKAIIYFIFFIAFFNIPNFSQSKIEMDLDSLLINAKKGIYWGLMNIPIKKARVDKSLIQNDRLIARIKVIKELNGVKVESTGYHNTNEMTIVIYRSAESLIKDGYIKKGDLELYSDEE